jgi:hypothetical protein
MNSGILVSVKAFQEVGGYSTDLPFYFSDPLFIYKIKKKYSQIYFLDAELDHDSFFITTKDHKLILERYKGMLKNHLIYGKLTNDPLSIVGFYRNGIRLSWRFKTTSFISSMINETFTTILK